MTFVLMHLLFLAGGPACPLHQEKIHLLENGLKVLKMAF